MDPSLIKKKKHKNKHAHQDVKHNFKKVIWAKKLRVSYVRLGTPAKPLWRKDIWEVCTGKTQGKVGRTALQSGNARGKEPCSCQVTQITSVKPQDRRKKRVGWEESRWEDEMRWDKLRWDYKVMSWAEMPFRNINCIKDLNMMTAWLNSHFKRPVWMLWRLLVKIVVKGGLVKRPAV